MQSFTMKREIVMETKNFVIIGNTQTAIENHISKALKLRFKTDDIIFFQNISDKSGFNEYIHQCIKKSCDKLYVMIVPWCEDYADIEKGIKKIFSDIKKNNNISLECTLIDSDSVIFNIADIIESGFFKSTLLHSKYVDSDANEIQKNSFSFIESRISRFNDNPVEKSILVRIIHSTADFSLEHDLIISDSAVKEGLNALHSNVPVITDVNMAASGLGRLYKDRTICAISHENSSFLAAKLCITRSAAGMECYKEKLDKAVVVIGNAPTALIQCLRIAERDKIRPALIIGCPVGFVGAAESKEELIRSGIPHIVIRGNRGGSNIAAAALNAFGDYL